MKDALSSYLESLARRLIRGCTAKTPDGVTLFTPDGVASYDALWLRDFAYMAEYAGGCITEGELEGCIRFALSGKRPDGWMPDRIYADGTVAYAAGVVGKPVGEANLDNTPFLIYTVYQLMDRMPAKKAKPLFEAWQDDLTKGLHVIPRSVRGLVYSDPAKPHSPYGFTDTVAKTGELMMESLLYWRACRMMARLECRFGVSPRADLSADALLIENSLQALYDEGSGMFLAATGDCRQIDIWGNAYLLYIGFPAGRAEETILSYLTEHLAEYTFKGQIRHLPRGEYWQRLLIDVKPGEYQNGAYWATATGWVLWCVAQKDPQKAMMLLLQAVSSFQDEGVFECVNEGYQKLDSFVVSAANVLGGFRRACRECPPFGVLAARADGE